jgi:hypothetical protein
MDVHVAMEITERLRRAGVDVMTAQEDGAELLPDEGILERAGTLGRGLFTQDQDFLVMAAKLQLAGVGFAGSFLRITSRRAMVSMRSGWRCMRRLGAARSSRRG